MVLSLNNYNVYELGRTTIVVSTRPSKSSGRVGPESVIIRQLLVLRRPGDPVLFSQRFAA